MRQLTSGDYDRFKALTRRLIKLAGGNEAAAALTGKAVSNIHGYGNPDKPCFAPIDVIADLEHDVGEPIVSRALFQTTPGDTPHVKAETLLEMGAVVSKELGEFQGAALAAIQKRSPGGKEITNGELDALIREFEDIVTAANRIHDQLCQARAAKRACIDLDKARAG